MVYILLALVFYTGVVLTSTAAARHLNSVFVAAIANAVSAIIPVILAISLLSKKTPTNPRFGILMAVLGGVMVSIFALAFNKSLAENKVGIVTPVLYGGTIFMSTIISYFIFKEKISAVEGIGLVLVLIGLSVIIYAKAAGV